MMKQFEDDGWMEEQTSQVIETENSVDAVRYKGERGLSILESKDHSLEPDMISGWRPKLPSCPLPLSYKNIYIDNIIHFLSMNNEYYITFMGARYMNSVQINQQYNYYWKYRERYSLNLAIIKQAVQKVGSLNCNPPKIIASPHKFDSSFQSGNLDLAVRIKPSQYDCFIRSDTNTRGHTNWFYFKITNGEEIGKIRINICNMTKTRNLYSKGMKPYVRVGCDGNWTQQPCYDVHFVERYCRYGFDKKTYQLQFSYNFMENNQEVYFAYAIPYTYTDLQKFVQEIRENNPTLVKSRRLCESLGGIDLPLLTITNPQPCSDGLQNIPNNQQQQKSSRKKSILITARIHPGQSNSSHVLQGFIRKLLMNIESSNILRTMFTFYIVPMLNPDGVIAGNFRTSYSGKDLNRQFNKLNKYIFPQITALCEFCSSLKKSNKSGVDFYFDFHGHSAKKNLFCYGPEHPNTKIYFFKARALAKIIQKINPIFSYRKSIFTINQCKRNTGRAYMLRTMKIPMTFTFEISNGLYEDQKKNDVKLNTIIMNQAGSTVIDGLYRYAQLQMKIPKKNISAKIDTNNKNQRNLASASYKRQSIFKKKSSQQRKVSLNSKSFKKSYSEDKTQTNLNNKQFIEILKQIKNQEEHIQIQGGSDSQGSEDDFNKQESAQLFTQIMKRNKQSSYNIRRTKKSNMQKMMFKSKQKKDDGDEENKISKKFISNRLIEMSKPPVSSNRNIKRGTSMQYDKIVLAQKNFTLLL